ncbi:hypothetical protein [Salinicola aestuarinus]|uniref:hypothetical protein n=1 Tax=Salinicola aestuarinus TaxID=1949082 RepID=UPI0013003E5F|nr:hypothetical protein [Salinicola aestuarinus]
MTKSLLTITLAALTAASLPALAAPGNTTDSQENLQQQREHYQRQRDALTGADRLDAQRQRVRDDQGEEANSGFLDAPVDTTDAPDQRDNDR